MIVTFVGFLGRLEPVAVRPRGGINGAVVAALVVTYFTFCPVFLFIWRAARWWNPPTVI